MEQAHSEGETGGTQREIDPLGLTVREFAEAMGPRVKGGKPAAVAAYRRLFREGVLEQEVVRARVAPVVRELRSECAEGEVVKFLQEVPGAQKGPSAGKVLSTESVLIPMIGKKGVLNYTLCVSSQVGCAMGCVFCETAQMGLIRSLEPREIVQQWFAATWGLGVRPRNMVFMGMGEPMDNFDNVLQAIAVLTDSSGPNMAMSKITVSTVGRLDGLERLKRKIHEPGWHRLNLAVSVNAPNDAVRSGIMPINRGMPMGELRKMLVDWPIYGGTAICMEYVLIPGVNDAREHARELAAFVEGIRCCVNLIPYNPRRDSPWTAPSEEEVVRFMGWLCEHGVFVKRRRTKGRDMMGACGQLGSAHIRRRAFVDLTNSAGQ